MCVLTATLVRHYLNEIINIYYSILPAFIGAHPYPRTYERGVKIIVATAHYVNDNLKEGPIIIQDVIHVRSYVRREDMMRGRTGGGEKCTEPGVILRAVAAVVRLRQSYRCFLTPRGAWFVIARFSSAVGEKAANESVRAR